MSDIIRLLPDSVANQIAAGEVIQRPASVVKELVENAVDAGAQHIQIIIADAGRTLIQVVDDGKGMTPTDARMAFERHATSKIQQAADLFALHTMGFRGEALASIAAVAQVDLRTMPQGADLGTRLVINGSKVESQCPEGCAPGTNIMVKNLFFNVPARRKFLKKDTVEMSNILREFERLALVNPGLDFELVNNGVTVHKIMRSTLKQRIADLFGKGLDKQLLPIASDTSIVRIDGFISRPEFARRRNALQYFTVNGRHMRHPYFHKTLMLCFEQLIPSDQQPNYFINFSVDPQTIDVNIHPTKNEIKFENESAIRQILTATVKESLGSFNAMPAIDFERSADGIDIPVFNPDSEARPTVELDPGYNPFATGQPVSTRQKSRESTLRNWEKLYEGFYGSPSRLSPPAAGGDDECRQTDLPGMDEPAALDRKDDRLSAPAEFGSLQLKNRFIVTPSKSGLMVVEQNRAHRRVLYERFLRRIAERDMAAQKVMFAEVLDLSPSQSNALESILPQLSEMGFELTSLGGNSWSINAVPAVLQADLNTRDTLQRIVEDVAAAGEEPTAALNSRVAMILAAASAVKAGAPLSTEEREHLIEELFSLPAPNYTPEGELIVSIIPLDRIIALF